MLVAFAWASAHQGEGHRVLGRLRRAAPPDAEDVGPVRWTSWQSSVDDLFPRGVRAYWKNASLDRIDGAVASILIRRAAQQRRRGTGFDIHHMGGAFASIPQDATPFPHRGARYWLNIYGYWPDPAQDLAHTAFIRGLAADIAPYATGGRYVNFMAAEDADGPGPVYDPAASARLAALKKRYDPANLFKINHNIPAQ